MSETHLCPECGAELAASAPRGLCPACLLKQGLQSQTVGYTGEGTQPPLSAQWRPPGVEELAGRFPELEIVRLIGRGGMGAVYQARQKNLDRMVALKMLPPEMGNDPAFARRFAREAQAMARLNHPHIVAIYEFGERGGWFYFLMEFVDGVNLRGLLDAPPTGSGRISPKEALAIVPQICEALQYAHEQGIVHRDIKPENILLNKQGQVKIADFGLAKLLRRTEGGGLRTESESYETASVKADSSLSTQSSVLITSTVAGTPQYMAPEQMERPAEVDHRADIYSLGVVFYQMLTGEMPVGRFAPPSKRVQVDVRLDEVVLKALEREPEKRYQQVSEVKTEVETIVGTPGIAAGREAMPVASSAAASSASEEAAFERARQDVRLPAVGLRISAWINLAAMVVVVGGIALMRVMAASPQPLGPGGVQLPSTVSALSLILPLMLVMFGFFLNVAILYGADRMSHLKSYREAVIASILAIIAAPLNLIGLPMGIWALVVLSRREVKDAFDGKSRSAGQVGGGPTAGAGTDKSVPTQMTPESIRALIATVILHLVAMMGVLGLFVFGVPRFREIFKVVREPLPAMTEIVLHGSLALLLPVGLILLTVDVAICVLLEYAGRRRLRQGWSLLVLLGLGMIVVVGVLALVAQ